MKLVVGLGNPGPEYAWSRHNAGWLLIDSFITRANLREPRMQFSGAFWSSSRVSGENVAFLKPFTYMNLSGKSVVEAARYFDISPSDVLVLFDDAALPFGKLRYRASGSAGGQKGMISILGGLGTLDVPRLRAGIGGPDAGIDMKGWVLGRFTNSQRDSWPLLEDLAWESFLKWLAGGAGDGFTVQIPDR
ncbi:MAG: aminoacyl-tRNA hydrolase [Synergistaceae bacterium]|nr:aminoacyl-tRNA hydrolase [Synergistaceae bacterium]